MVLDLEIQHHKKLNSNTPKSHLPDKILLFIIIGCKDNNSNGSDNSASDVKVNETKEVNNMVKAIINKEEYIVNLEDNETAKSFVKMLPKKYDMSELNGNEKYIAA